MTPARMAAIHAAAMQSGRGWSAREIADLLLAPGALHVANDPAFAIGRVVLDEAELLTLAVDPQAQKQGHGGACLARFHDAVAAAGATSVFLEVAETNAAARALYARAGYAQIGRRAAYYGPGEDAIALRLNLSP